LLVGATLGAFLIVSNTVARRRRPRNPATLLRAIPGNDRTALVAVLGPPRASAGFSAVAPALLVSADYLQADTWYYPLDLRAKTALVVHFDQGIARDAQIVSLPKFQKLSRG
jgi:hypothetical protein